MNLAPIVLFAYNRPDYLKKTLQFLKKNPLAKESILYFIVDGPKDFDSPENLKKIQEVKKIAEKLTGFKEIIKIFNEKNLGLGRNIHLQVSRLFKEHKTLIILEDDIEIAEDFLEFIHQGLKFYKDNQKIGAISGYSYNYELIDMSQEIVFSPRFSSLGWATWQDRWEGFDYDLEEFNNRKKLKESRNQFNRGGLDFFPMLMKTLQGKTNSWAIRWSYFNFLKNRYCVVPKYSKISHFGVIGTNYHSLSKNISVKTKAKKFEFTNEITGLEEVIQFNRNYYRPSWIRRIINILKGLS